MISLVSLSVTDISIINKVDLKDKEIQVNVSHTINDFHDKSKCDCDTSVSFIPKELDESKFKVYVNLHTSYNYDEPMRAEELHAKTFESVFPHLRSTVASAMTASLIPPLFLNEEMVKNYKDALDSGAIKL